MDNQYTRPRVVPAPYANNGIQSPLAINPSSNYGMPPLSPAHFAPRPLQQHQGGHIMGAPSGPQAIHHQQPPGIPSNVRTIGRLPHRPEHYRAAQGLFTRPAPGPAQRFDRPRGFPNVSEATLLTFMQDQQIPIYHTTHHPNCMQMKVPRATRSSLGHDQWSGLVINLYNNGYLLFQGPTYWANLATTLVKKMQDDHPFFRMVMEALYLAWSVFYIVWSAFLLYGPSFTLYGPSFTMYGPSF